MIDDDVDETQSQMFIDLFWMQEIFEINVSIRDDEMVENDEIETVISDEMVEMVQIDDKY